MKKLIFALFFPLFLFGFSISINSGVEKGKPYSIIEIKDSNEFECIEQILAYNTKRYACMLDDDGIVDIDDIDLLLMDIRYKKEGKKLFVVVLPKANSRLINGDNKLFQTQDVYPNKSKHSKHFSIVIDPNLSEFDSIMPNGVNFSAKFDSLLLPSIGALDFSKAPIEGFDSNDIDIYIGIKRSFDNGAFARVIDDTKIAIERHPQSIFSGEFLLYRLKAMDRLFDTQNEYEELTPDNIIKEGRAWIRKFPSDENYPEVIYMIARAYIKENLLSDAKYMIDTLLNEHKESKFTTLAMLDYADELYKVGRAKEALKLYEEVLYSTAYIDVASRAALSLASNSVEKESMSDAKKYVLKILNANKDYFLRDKQKAMDLANAFLSKDMPGIAAKIYEILVNGSTKRDEIYEATLKNLGLAMAKAGEINEAYKYLSRYQQEFKYGEYTSEVESARDGLFFELGETNSTKLHAHYDALMQRYERGDIGIKALISKMELNANERKFKENLIHTNTIRDINSTRGTELLNYSALEIAKEAIRQNDCQSVINLLEAYDVNRLEIPQFKLHECFVRTARYQDSLNLAKAHVFDENLLDRVEWLVKLSQSFYLNKEYENSVKAANEAISLGSSVEHSDSVSALFYRFYSLLKLDRFTEAIQTIRAVSELKGGELKLIEAYDELSKYAFSKSDFANASTYAKKALEIQYDMRLNTYSPSLNFIYANSSIKLENLNEALDEAKYILSLKLKPKDRSRALSLIADIYILQKQPNLAKPYLQECVKANFQSTYKSVCEAQLERIK